MLAPRSPTAARAQGFQCHVFRWQRDGIQCANEILQDIIWTLKMCWDPVSLVSHGLGEETSP